MSKMEIDQMEIERWTTHSVGTSWEHVALRQLLAFYKEVQAAKKAVVEKTKAKDLTPPLPFPEVKETK